MSFSQQFLKTAAKSRKMSDIELALKSEKHLKGAMKHEHAPQKGAATGAVVGTLGGLAGKGSGKMKWPAAAASTAASIGAGSGVGLGLKKWHQKRLRNYLGELSRRGFVAVPTPSGDGLRWVPKRRYYSEGMG